MDRRPATSASPRPVQSRRLDGSAFRPPLSFSAPITNHQPRRRQVEDPRRRALRGHFPPSAFDCHYPLAQTRSAYQHGASRWIKMLSNRPLLKLSFIALGSMSFLAAVAWTTLQRKNPAGYVYLAAALFVLLLAVIVIVHILRPSVRSRLSTGQWPPVGLTDTDGRK